MFLYPPLLKVIYRTAAIIIDAIAKWIRSQSWIEVEVYKIATAELWFSKLIKRTCRAKINSELAVSGFENLCREGEILEDSLVSSV